MIKILLDADLILEILINRNTFEEDVSKLMDIVHPSIRMYITEIGWQKIYTYTKCLQNHKIAEIVINWLQDKIRIFTVEQTILQQARSSPLKDFESAVELVCANYEKLDAIVTHNLNNFAEAPNKYLIWSLGEFWVRANLEIQLKITSSN
ncbi:hypothetical protein QUB80_04175 [Chlorogloeopsis sp. ULAP01]|uniref:PIN domain-containing protein n=1 Tax=Chlorogloeopsis sp. ULAP01 TaxID=3056483 RepID=UPI0025AB0693|nr:PIN domain-containing protein [Chlorogloeopsis sp. ULAP01]MDM9379895.1 hypothetical protein [Chlorogloeopsis sp. ULAP01]